MRAQTGFIRHIHNLNSWRPENFTPWTIDGQRAGFLKAHMIDALSDWPDAFRATDAGLQFAADITDFAARSAILADITRQLADAGVIPRLTGEQYPVTGPGGRADRLALLDRAAAGSFGIKTYGQHLNGYVMGPRGMSLWVARRAADRVHFPNKLDNIVAGGLPQHLSLEQNLLKECAEEAALSSTLARQARAVGTVSYCRETEIGLKPDTLYCYDLELPPDFIPRNTDGEVADFTLMDIDDAVRLVHDSDELKLNCNLVFLDFFIRHGYIDPEHPDYLALTSGLHNTT